MGLCPSKDRGGTMLEQTLTPEFWTKETIGLLTALVGLLVTILGLLTAIVGFKKARTVEHARTSTTSRLKLRSLEGVQPGRWSPSWLKTVLVVGGGMSLLMMVAGLVSFISDPSLVTVWPALVFSLFTVGYIDLFRRFWGKKEIVPIINREASLTVQGTCDQVMEECAAALRRMKAQINTISKDGVIQAKTGWSWRGSGEDIVIRISEFGGGEWAVSIRSSSSLPTTMIDLGKNASNINRFVKELIG